MRSLDPVVISVTRFHAGTARQCLARSGDSWRYSQNDGPAVRQAIGTGFRRLCVPGIEATYGVSINVDTTGGYPPTINAPAPSEIARIVARRVVGDNNKCTLI
ncbi:MAG: hypothetical protein IPO38_13300 [Rhodocyclaceae bacterium]|nr:hypothetical protein [Rhodocyclaceae bacterium]